MKKFKSILLKVLLGVAVFGIIYMLFLYFANYSTGTRAGVVMKISRKGMVFKTNEGMLDVGTINDPWPFSVKGSDEEVVRLLDEVQQTGERVQLHYQEKYVQLPWRGDTKYFVIKVDRLEK